VRRERPEEGDVNVPGNRGEIFDIMWPFEVLGHLPHHPPCHSIVVVISVVEGFGKFWI